MNTRFDMASRLRKCSATFLAGVLVGGTFATPTLAQSTEEKVTTAATPGPAAAAAKRASPYRPVSVSKHARDHYQAVWGIDNLMVNQTASGNLIRFSYRVVDPTRAEALSDKKATPYMVGQRSRAVLQVPVMDKVGPLRQTTGAPGAGQKLWMVFSNKGNPIKPGDRVDVIIGSFLAAGLKVE